MIITRCHTPQWMASEAIAEGNSSVIYASRIEDSMKETEMRTDSEEAAKLLHQIRANRGTSAVAIKMSRVVTAAVLTHDRNFLCTQDTLTCLSLELPGPLYNSIAHSSGDIALRFLFM
jgi:hypothetical protein